MSLNEHRARTLVVLLPLAGLACASALAAPPAPSSAGLPVASAVSSSPVARVAELAPPASSAPAASPTSPGEVRAAAVHVRADRLDVDLDGRSARLEGEVELRRADLVLRCPSLEARFDARPSVVWARARGGVVVEAPALGAVASADEATVDLARGIVELRGRVVLRRGGSRLAANEASLDLHARRVALAAVTGAIALADASAHAAPAPPAPPDSGPR